MKWLNSYPQDAPKWPAGAKLRVGTDSRWRIRADADDGLRPRLRANTVGFICAADTTENTIVVMVNPAIAWEGTYQELHQYWEEVPDDTLLTF